MSRGEEERGRDVGGATRMPTRTSSARCTDGRLRGSTTRSVWRCAQPGDDHMKAGSMRTRGAVVVVVVIASIGAGAVAGTRMRDDAGRQSGVLEQERLVRAEVIANAGGIVKGTHATVSFPPAAVDGNAVMQLSRSTSADDLPRGYVPAGAAVQIELSGGTLVGVGTVRLEVDSSMWFRNPVVLRWCASPPVAFAPVVPCPSPAAFGRRAQAWRPAVR